MNIKLINIVKSILIGLCIGIHFSAISCNIQKTNFEAQNALETNPKLIFLNYSISKNGNGTKTMVLINKTITDGRLKDTSPKTEKKGDFICMQKDKNYKNIQTNYIKNPFYKTIEYVGNSLKFERKEIDVTTAHLALRLQLNSNTKFIVISEIIDDLKKTNRLIETKLD